MGVVLTKTVWDKMSFFHGPGLGMIRDGSENPFPCHPKKKNDRGKQALDDDCMMNLTKVLDAKFAMDLFMFCYKKCILSVRMAEIVSQWV